MVKLLGVVHVLGLAPRHGLKELSESVRKDLSLRPAGKVAHAQRYRGTHRSGSSPTRDIPCTGPPESLSTATAGDSAAQRFAAFVCKGLHMLPHRAPQGVRVVIMPGSISRKCLNMLQMYLPKLLREYSMLTSMPSNL